MVKYPYMCIYICIYIYKIGHTLFIKQLLSYKIRTSLYLGKTWAICYFFSKAQPGKQNTRNSSEKMTVLVYFKGRQLWNEWTLVPCHLADAEAVQATGNVFASSTSEVGLQASLVPADMDVMETRNALEIPRMDNTNNWNTELPYSQNIILQIINNLQKHCIE